MKTIIALALIIVSGIMVWYFSRDLQTAEHKDKLQKVTVGNTAGYPNLAILAEEKGYFEKNGLNVSFRDYEKPMIKDLIEEKIDIVSATAEFVVVRNIFNEKDLQIVASVSTQQNQWEVVGRRDKNIQNIGDLKGKTIAVQRGTAGEFFLAEFLLFNNLRMSDITVVDLELKPRMEQLTRGQIDAVVILSPYTQQMKNTLGENAISWPAQAGRSIYSLSYTTERFVKEHPDIIERYLRALIAAEAFVSSNETEARKIMQNKLRFNDNDIQALWPIFNFEVKLEQELLPVMGDQARWAITNKITDQKKVPDYLDFIYFDGLKKIKPEAITIIH